MEGTKTSLRAMQLKLKREAELKERIAAFAVFIKNAEKAKKLSRNLQARQPTSGCGPRLSCLHFFGINSVPLVYRNKSLSPSLPS